MSRTGHDRPDPLQVQEPHRCKTAAARQPPQTASPSPARGERAIAALWTIQERVEDGLYEGFTQAERERLPNLLRRVQSNALRLTRSPDR